MLSLSVPFLVGDEIYLSSGRKIEGTVIHETDFEITVLVAMGEVSFDKSKIDRIVQTEAGDVVREELLLEVQFEEDVEALKRSLASMYTKKGTVSLHSAKSKTLKKKFDVQVNDLLSKRQDLAKTMKDLEPFKQYGSNIPQSVYSEYQVLYGRYQTQSTEVQNIENEVAQLHEEYSELSARTMAAEKAFAESLFAVREKYNGLIEKGCPRRVLGFAEKSLMAYDSVLNKQVVPLRRVGKSFVLPVTINGTVTRDFILDTGCSTVAINQSVETALNFDEKDYIGTFQSKIADGSVKKVKGINLRTITVGSFTVENVVATTPVESANGETPLLLGMGFLRHFHFSIDFGANTLILERLQQ